MIPASSERDALRGLLSSAIGPVGGPLVWLLVRLVSAALYPWFWAWSQARHWQRHREAREGRMAWFGVAAACALVMTSVAIARHAGTPALVARSAGPRPAQTEVHSADGCAGGHRSPLHC
ncbi:hypothetical protein [Ideonella sp. YS5]|uniref:hypothetical protein n=1 Tax=Ideonella sp. YS5 TaxID=3453714 RepID=UPI003EEDF7F9